ncbi:oxidoreductase [Nocardioides sp. AE5]|uniref:oxidoreductase n=1 Tax=Nocardioides sp. AE5 TaxID=2962573 RepID=UPI0028812873|nr:oxidoreductase [Nocardioides sp. AE5]MDT0203455.1 oxidoreductase [Nocardioides sp. AE5]
MTWTLADLGDQSGKTFLVTGATSGLGQVTATELARAGARVVLAARSPGKLATTQRAIASVVPGADLADLLVDLADLSSVRAAAKEAATLGPIDVLVNNAGVMATPQRRTVDGLDLQLGTNHFGPFLFTGLLLDQLVASGAGRVVTVSSNAHLRARKAPLHDPHQPVPGYNRWSVYCGSKLANLLFTYELDRRARAAGLPVQALAAHPGYAATHLLAHGQTLKGSGAASSILDAVMKVGAQSAEMGALPTLMAATADLPGGTYVGPRGFGGFRGLPEVVKPSRLARDEAAQRAMWELSETTVGWAWPHPA